LHLQEGLAVMKETVASGKVIRRAPAAIDGTKNRRSPLVVSPYFVVEMFELKEAQDFPASDASAKSSVQILVAVEGCGLVEAHGAEPVTLAKGDAVVIPASLGDFHVRPQWTVEFLKASLPGKPASEPAVRAQD
jgi:mannose-6-phosphate isomerase class I